MTARRVDIGGAELAPEAPGIASRAIEVDGVRWALVTYEPGVLREEFCDEGHSGYVVAGEIVYEFSACGEPLALRSGDGFALPGARAHRGRAGAEGATLFLIDSEVGHGR